MQITIKGRLYCIYKSTYKSSLFNLWIENKSTQKDMTTIKEFYKIEINLNMLDKYKSLEGQNVEIPCILYLDGGIRISAKE